MCRIDNLDISETPHASKGSGAVLLTILRRIPYYLGKFDNDLTATSLEPWLIREIIPKWLQFSFYSELLYKLYIVYQDYRNRMDQRQSKKSISDDVYAICYTVYTCIRVYMSYDGDADSYCINGKNILCTYTVQFLYTHT